jgi:hypothetical protein
MISAGRSRAPNFKVARLDPPPCITFIAHYQCRAASLCLACLFAALGNFSSKFSTHSAKRHVTGCSAVAVVLSGEAIAISIHVHF